MKRNATLILAAILVAVALLAVQLQADPLDGAGGDFCESIIQTRIYEPGNNMPLASWSASPPRVGERVFLTVQRGSQLHYLVQQVQWDTPRDTHNCGVVTVRVSVVRF